MESSESDFWTDLSKPPTPKPADKLSPNKSRIVSSSPNPSSEPLTSWKVEQIQQKLENLELSSLPKKEAAIKVVKKQTMQDPNLNIETIDKEFKERLQQTQSDIRNIRRQIANSQKTLIDVVEIESAALSVKETLPKKKIRPAKKQEVDTTDKEDVAYKQELIENVSKERETCLRIFQKLNQICIANDKNIDERRDLENSYKNTLSFLYNEREQYKKTLIENIDAIQENMKSSKEAFEREMEVVDSKAEKLKKLSGKLKNELSLSRQVLMKPSNSHRVHERLADYVQERLKHNRSTKKQSKSLFARKSINYSISLITPSK